MLSIINIIYYVLMLLLIMPIKKTCNLKVQIVSRHLSPQLKKKVKSRSFHQTRFNIF